MAIIDIKVDDLAVIARFDSMSQRMHDRMFETISKLGSDLLSLVQVNLSGKVLQQHSQLLIKSQNLTISDSDRATKASVGFNTAAVRYGAIQEFGGTTRPHFIEARNKAALRFVFASTVIFRKNVNHPGSKIPERSFLRSALKELSSKAISDIRTAAETEAQS